MDAAFRSESAIDIRIPSDNGSLKTARTKMNDNVSQLRRRGEGEQDVDRAGHLHRRCFCCGYHHSRRSHGARLVDRRLRVRRRSRGRRGKSTERGELIPQQGWMAHTWHFMMRYILSYFFPYETKPGSTVHPFRKNWG